MGLLDQVKALQEQLNATQTLLNEVIDASQTIADEAYAKGKEDGMVEGKSVGLEEGKVIGKSEGIEEGKVLGYNEGYPKGFADGVASVGNGNKIYSQEESDALVKAAVDPLNEKISAMQVQLDGVSGDLQKAQERIMELQKVVDEMPVKLEEAKKAGAEELKMSLKAAYEAQQVAESEGETGFKKLLE